MRSTNLLTYLLTGNEIETEQRTVRLVMMKMTNLQEQNKVTHKNSDWDRLHCNDMVCVYGRRTIITCMPRPHSRSPMRDDA